jgi:hypothetical protein
MTSHRLPSNSFPFCVALTTALACCATTACADPPNLLTVDQAVLTDAVDRASHTFLHPVTPPFARKQVALWMQLRGTPELLDQIKSANGKITVHHVWRKYVLNGVETRLDQPLDIGRQEDIAKLAGQVAASGYFTWHTWSDKQNLSSGNWRVDLEFDGHVPVMCPGDGGEMQACSYPFEVE